MKVIFITREGYNLPGARIRCYNFSRELSKYGIDTEVLSFSDTLGAKDGEEEFCLSMRDKIKFNYLAFKKLSKEKGAILYLQRFNYHSFAPYLVNIFKKNKLILDLDDWEMRENPKYYFFYPSSKAHCFTRQIAKKSIFCIAASRFFEEFLLPFNKKVFYVPSGVDTELFKPFLSDLSVKEKVIFSWVGTFHKKEYVDNIKFALDCFSLLRKQYSYIYFDIIGSGIYKDVLEKIVDTFGDPNICLKGWIRPEAIPNYLNTIDIGIVPVARDTKFNRAKSPTKLFEYMAMAKPVVAGAIGEASNIIENGINGLLAETKDEFVKNMQELIMNSQLRRQMGEKARKTVEKKYSLTVLGKRLFKAIDTA